jgi:hypothetical protein
MIDLQKRKRKRERMKCKHKRIFTAGLACLFVLMCLTLTLFGCTPNAPAATQTAQATGAPTAEPTQATGTPTAEPTQAAAPTAEPTQAALDPTAVPEPEVTPGPTAAPFVPSAITEAQIAQMYPVFDSLVRTMRGYGDKYLPEDPHFFWDTLYQLSMHQLEYEDPLVLPVDSSQDDFTKAVFYKVLQEVASAAFTPYDDLLPLPQDMSGYLRFNAQTERYEMLDSSPDIGDTLVEGAEDLGDGTVRVSVNFTGFNEEEKLEILDQYAFIVAPNEITRGLPQPLFELSVLSAALTADE